MPRKLTSVDIRIKFLNFFSNRGHAIIKSASLVTSDEKGITNPTLFNTAGMQPLIPFLLGKTHPDGRRLANIQKCLRTVDIDSIGDNTHATFFEMMGNWSLGDYFKKEAINWSYQFLTNIEDGLGLNPSQLYVSVFKGNTNAPVDEEASNIWQETFSKENIKTGGDTRQGNAGRIFYLPAENNWWEAGDYGPCGPDTEIFYDVANKFNGELITEDQFIKADNSRVIIEVWNNVFMQYEKSDGKIIGKLKEPSVDTGAGLERLTMTLEGVNNIYDTDLLLPVMKKIEEIERNKDILSERIIADHIKSAVHMIADGVIPSNTDRGYVLRKLIRRAIRHSDILKMEPNTSLIDVAHVIQNIYGQIYVEVLGNDSGLSIRNIIRDEEIKFRETLSNGLKEFEKLSVENISGHDAFSLFSSYGFPLELTLELSKEKGILVDIGGFKNEFKNHQDLSRAGASLKFKGGLADSLDPMVIRYHTATHILHQALHDVLCGEINQKGSNITKERLRFDFSWNTKMTDEEKKKVEDIVNSKIKDALPVNKVSLSLEDALKTGARHLFNEKYGDEISIYYIGNTDNDTAKSLTNAYSKEFCGGPHVSNTKDLAGPEGKWLFKIQKEEAVSQGVRRIKAVLV